MELMVRQVLQVQLVLQEQRVLLDLHFRARSIAARGSQKVYKPQWSPGYIFRQIEPLPVTPGLRSVQELETLDGEVGRDYEVAHSVALKSEIMLLPMP